jgi:cell wall-associated NlpC family hydrolase
MLKPKKLLPIILSTLLLLQNFSIITAFAEPINYGSAITSRLAGVDRYATSIAISKNGWDQATNVIISTGSNFPDALSASALSKSKDAPIILISKDSISAKAIAELKRLNVSNAYLIGGTGVISTSVENQLKSLNISIIRFAGTDRYDTSKQIANYMGVNSGIIVATGADFPDALSVAPISAMKSMPILLSQKSGLDANMSAFIKSKNIPVSYIIGGTGVLDASIDRSLPNSKRLSGNDRFGTNLSINNNFASNLSFNTVYLATGLDFPDALSGSALAAKNNAPIILTDKALISTEIINFMKNNNVKHVVILGGTGVVSQALEDSVNDKIKVNVTSISLNKSSETLTVGSSYAITASVSPLNATNQSVTWSSSNSSAVTVDSNGKVAAVSVGTATITAKTVDGNKSDTCNVVVLTDRTSKGEQVVHYAENFIGTPYVWGGTSPTSGFDCSGFTQYVYAHFGIEIARNTYSQITYGYEVPKGQLQLGDLVFFGNGDIPHHVGIYVGYGQYIHAPRTGEVVKVSPLSSRSDFLAARRIYN